MAFSILNWLGFRAPSAIGVQSPYSPPADFMPFALAEIMGDLAAITAVDRSTALRVPGVKRAHGIHTSIAGGLNFYMMDGDQRAAEQPAWLTSSKSGISPLQRNKGIVSDLFMRGWACVGFNAPMDDCIHIPEGYWGLDDKTGEITIDQRMPAEYRAKPIAIPLGYGENGILVDGADSIRAARSIDRAWIDRINNPVPQTNLHITDPAYDELSKSEKKRIIKDWNDNRAASGGATTLTQSFLTVEAMGTTEVSLFEKGRNAVRLDLANHCAVPASIIEGSKDGSGSDINYSNDATARNELYDFGTKTFVQAIEARLSLDDVCPPGMSIRADLSGLMAFPSPDLNPTSAD